VITDAALLFIPVPLLWTLNAPLKKKLVIGMFLSSGIFVISASIIRTSITLSLHPSSLLVNSWGVRETFVGIAAVNLAIFAPILRKDFWTHGSLKSAGGQSSGTRSHTGHITEREHAIREARTEDGLAQTLGKPLE